MAVDGSHEDDTRQWCLGLPFDAHREADLLERRRLYKLATSARRRARLLFTAAATALLGGILTAWAAGLPHWAHLRLPALIAAGAAILALAPSLALLARERLSHARKLLSDLDGGVVARYEGELGPLRDLESAARRLLNRGLLEPDPRRTQRIEVSPGAGVVVRVNGRWVQRSLRAHVARVASPRPHGYATTLPNARAWVKDPGVELLRRSLSPAELAELSQYRKRFQRRFWWSIGLAGPLTVCLVAWLTLELSGPPLLAALVSSAALSLVGWASYQLWLRVTRRLEDDCELRWVITMRQASEDGSQLEVLPCSRLVWTERHRPAAWRLSPW
jgi:hypothetical protein